MNDHHLIFERYLQIAEEVDQPVMMVIGEGDYFRINYSLDGRIRIIRVDSKESSNIPVGNTVGTKIWHVNSILHRLDGPAIEWADGSREWYVRGKRHRLDGPAIDYVDGAKFWYVEGLLHREDGPAIEWETGSKEWYVRGKHHREDGPARKWDNGSKEWWINDQQYSTIPEYARALFKLKGYEDKIGTLVFDKFVALMATR